MVLIIEDGSGKENSNSYTSVQELEAFAALRGVALPSSKEELLVKAADYISFREPEFQGSRKNPVQALAFPRKGLTINCEAFPDDQIPPQVKKAQLQAALEIVKHQDLSPSQMNSPVHRERVEGAVDRTFMTPRQLSTRPDGSGFTPRFPKIDAYLFFVLKGNECPADQTPRVRLVRV